MHYRLLHSCNLGSRALSFDFSYNDDREKKSMIEGSNKSEPIQAD